MQQRRALVGALTGTAAGLYVTSWSPGIGVDAKLFDGAKIWPIRWWQDASDNITRYVMHPRIAEWWRAA